MESKTFCEVSLYRIPSLYVESTKKKKKIKLKKTKNEKCLPRAAGRGEYGEVCKNVQTSNFKNKVRQSNLKHRDIVVDTVLYN